MRYVGVNWLVFHVLQLLPFCLVLIFLFFLGHKLKISLQERSQNTTNMGKLAQLVWQSRNNVRILFIHSHDNQVTLGHNKSFDPPS